jgi:hypothetical protein
MKGKSHGRGTYRSSGCNLRLYSQYLLFCPDCPVHFLLPAQSLEDRKIPICRHYPPEMNPYEAYISDLPNASQSTKLPRSEKAPIGIGFLLLLARGRLLVVVFRRART